MKKLLVAAAVAAMAVGAQAADPWTFQLELYNYESTGFGGNTAVYLVDTAHSKILAYTTQGEYNSPNEFGVCTWKYVDGYALDHSNLPEKAAVPAELQSYDVVESNMKGGKLTIENNGDGTWDLVFNFNGQADSTSIYGADGSSVPSTYNSENLAYLLWDDVAGKVMSYQVALTDTHGATASKTYANAPEPTSGLLLLMGLAGLALKRKRAA